MKAIVCEAFGPLDDLQFKDVADPVVKKGHVVVNVEAAGVNFPDGLLVQGLYQMQPDFPFIPGNEVAGGDTCAGGGGRGVFYRPPQTAFVLDHIARPNGGAINSHSSFFMTLSSCAAPIHSAIIQ